MAGMAELLARKESERRMKRIDGGEDCMLKCDKSLRL
jgi:hypothetical protein